MLDLYDDDEREPGAARCARCPRPGEARTLLRTNFGSTSPYTMGGPFLLEAIVLCEGCALLEETVL